MAAAKKPDIHLYTAQTPNGIKISITLEELGLPYTTHKIDMGKSEQKEDWFLEINPNGRIPALTDSFTDETTIRLFESGSIMQYLIAEYDKDHKISYPAGTREYYEMNNWLFFLNAGLGPMQGQSNHFTRYSPTPILYSVTRYQTETKRLYRTLNTHLAHTQTPYLVGSKCTIADIAHWGWIAAAGWAGVDISEFPEVEKWEGRMADREGVERGRHVPEPHRLKEMMKDPEWAKKEAERAREWVQEGMRRDREGLNK